MTTWLAMVLVACGPGEVGEPIGEPPPDEKAEELGPIDLDELPLAESLEGWELQVHPATGNVPANVGQISIDFGRPMSLSRPSSRLYTASGKRVPDAIDKVRWDGPIQVVTFVLEDLEVGARYALVVQGMSSSDGTPVPRFQHPFRIFPPDTDPPSGDALMLEGDAEPGSLAALEIRFPEPMGARTLDALTLLIDGKPGDGSWQLVEQGLVARYTPASPWAEGASISAGVSGGAVDVAGNAMVDAPQRMLSPVKRLAP